MNQRIIELQAQAFEECEIYEDNGIINTDEVFKRFAELIVIECATLIDTLYEAYGAPSTASKFIKQHFGVKE